MFDKKLSYSYTKGTNQGINMPDELLASMDNEHALLSIFLAALSESSLEFGNVVATDKKIYVEMADGQRYAIRISKDYEL